MNEIEKLTHMCSDLTLLYVDDNVSLFESMSDVLYHAFKSVIFAKNGLEALEKLNISKVDMIITDLNMPQMNGMEFIETVRGFDKEISIIITSAHTESEYFIKAIEYDVSGFLIKPFDFQSLIKIIKKVALKINTKKTLDESLSLVHQYHFITDKSAIVSKTDVNGFITHVNDKFCKISGFNEDELIGKNHSIVRHPSSESEMFENLWYTIKKEKKPWQGIIKNITKDGRTTYLQTTINPIFDREGNVSEYIALRNDVTEMMQPRKQFIDFIINTKQPFVALMKIEDYDNLLSFFGDHLVESLATEFTKKFCGILLRLCPYSKFIYIENGIFGFALDLYECKIETNLLIEKIKSFQNTVYEAHIYTKEIEHDISINVSIAYKQEPFINAELGLSKLEQLKQKFIIANNILEQERQKAHENLKTLQIIKYAIDKQKVMCLYQPIVDNKTQKILKYETLIRIIDKEYNTLLPFKFLDIAKKASYYPQLTTIVLENAFAMLHKIDKEISVNISLLDISKHQDKEKIINIIKKNKNVTDRMIFEILEDESSNDFTIVEEFIKEVKQFGIKIAIDDFGSGYSNFERFVQFQPDIIKIDGSLIKNIHKDDFSLSVVKTIISFTKEQNLKTVAEFVENEEIYNTVKEIGVDFSQGYFFGKPQHLNF